MPVRADDDGLDLEIREIGGHFALGYNQNNFVLELGACCGWQCIDQAAIRQHREAIADLVIE